MCRLKQIILLTLIKVYLINSDDYFDYPAEPADGGRRYTNLYDNGPLYTREIKIKQGYLKGIIVESRRSQQGLVSVEKYLGLPYAAAPVGPLRFMPPGTAPPWTGLRLADKMAPVCPQNPPKPDASIMSFGRLSHLKRLLPFLKNQSEDCLYLNIYAPAQDSSHSLRRHPVIIFIHGESYEWNSGNAYDGSVLASYGRVVVVTINFRLGILGFMRPGNNDHTVGNFALLDQVAALQWVKDNIESFGGESSQVTLMGHSTGAACANLLMLSPVADGLFHRAILMSGSALADWAINRNPMGYTIQVAHALNCPSGDEMGDCLRKIRLEDIMKVKVQSPQYTTPFGPVIDGQVIPNDPDIIMRLYNEQFSRYDLLYGVTEYESYHLLRGVDLQHGMLEKEKNSLLRFYLTSRFEYRPDTALESTIRQYSNQYYSSTDYSADNHRDFILDVLSDARVTAPVVQTGNYHSHVNPKSYFYVFAHNSLESEYVNIEKSVHGQELPYVFGAPLDLLDSHFPMVYHQKEALFSEAVMTYFTNFANTGNPNAPRKNYFINMNPEDWRVYDVDWPEYDSKNQSYLFLGTTPHVGRKYRYKYMDYWNHILPETLKNQTSSVYPQIYKRFPTSIVTDKPVWGRVHSSGTSTSREEMYGRVNPMGYRPVTLRTTEDPYMIIRKMKEPVKSSEMSDSQHKKTAEIDADDSQTSSMTINYLIALGVIILLINVLAIGIFYYRKVGFRKDRGIKRALEKIEGTDTEENLYEKRMKLEDVEANAPDCNMINLLKSNSKTEDSYEPVKNTTKGSDFGQRFKLTRGSSTSTIDPHTKVRDWIHQEIVQRCSPKFLRRRTDNVRKEVPPPKPNAKVGSLTGSLKSPVDFFSNKSSKTQSTRPMSPNADPSVKSITTNTESNGSKCKSLLKKPKKVSVAIDATPSARSNSVLKQEPIELSKSLDYSSFDETQHMLRRCQTTEELIKYDDNTRDLRRNSTSISLQLAPNLTEITQPIDATVVKIEHFHSKSDPVSESNYIKQKSNGIPKMQTFSDVNVTSKDDDIEHALLSPEEALQTIKRRKYPKVLPDLPQDDSQFPPSLSHAQIIAQKRRSLPPQSNYTLPTLHEHMTKGDMKIYSRIPPAPPPRISSTLGRRPNQPSCDVSSFMLAEEPPIPPEPTITSNTLHVGPLIPNKSTMKKPEDLYSTVKKDPIYDNIYTKTDPIYESLKSGIKPPDNYKNQAKTIISANSNTPIKRLEPKVIIKPSISRKASDPKQNRNVPRVTAQNDAENSLAGVHKVENKPLKQIIKREAVTKSKIPAPTKVTDEREPSTSDSSNDTNSTTGTVKRGKI